MNDNKKKKIVQRDEERIEDFSIFANLFMQHMIRKGLGVLKITKLLYFEGEDKCIKKT